MRLALKLGKTLSELETMPRDEFVRWIAYYQLEPWGCEAEDHRTELGLQVLCSINGVASSKIPRFIDRDPEDNYKPDPTPEELDEKVRDFFIGRTAKAEAETPPPKKPRKPRKDKGTKRDSAAKASTPEKISPPAK
ncbi:phage tail assembly protein T [Sphingomonas aerophila]|uniref:Minor tail T domain-containing protein n=1 Tax=Sphingomonas aerophila TaxID=1344948 RepID=A0A7W9BET4_9SPHN|nr:hypothetical protein [Sphingomonas aerophila]MBB5715847.1 hypothetical protein [Sphingomonas aerophila]